jgi:hypothetical protein
MNLVFNNAGDVNGDGYPDFLLHFRTQDTGIEFGDTEACLTASLIGGGSFTSCDPIITVPLNAIAP